MRQASDVERRRQSSTGQRLTVKDPGALAVFIAALLEDYPDLAAEIGLS